MRSHKRFNYVSYIGVWPLAILKSVAFSLPSAASHVAIALTAKAIPYVFLHYANISCKVIPVEHDDAPEFDQHQDDSDVAHRPR